MVDQSADLPKNQHTFTRQQLYELIWKQPVRAVASAIGVSDVAVAKACRRLNIPVPGRGYWAKLAAGHPLTRVPLRPDPHGRTEVRFDARPPAAPIATIEELARASEAGIDGERTSPALPQRPIAISDLSKPHALTRSARGGLRRQSSDSRGLRFAVPAIGWKVAVSETTTERALVLLDSICHALKDVGATVRDGPKVHWQNEVPKGVYLDDEPLQVSIREHVRQHRRTAKELAQRTMAGEVFPGAYDYQPSGTLVASIPNAPHGTLSEWRDSKSSLLEALIPEIVAALIALPVVFKNARREREAAELKSREEEHRRWKIEARERRNKERLSELLAESRALNEQTAILAYLDHLDREVTTRGYKITDKLAKGLAKARQLAAMLDPTEKRVALLQTFGLVTESESRYYREADEENA